MICYVMLCYCVILCYIVLYYIGQAQARVLRAADGRPPADAGGGRPPLGRPFRGAGSSISTPNPPSKIVPAKMIRRREISGKLPMYLRIPPLEIKILLGSNPLKSMILVRRLVVPAFHRNPALWRLLGPLRATSERTISERPARRRTLRRGPRQPRANLLRPPRAATRPRLSPGRTSRGD